MTPRAFRLVPAVLAIAAAAFLFAVFGGGGR